ncbi:MAG: marine proteobacterial sortase target protein [Alphaproteobacteria bacterium]|nr:marine proteobacterial sortase target protein [Alphaproteobacteria bacterium]
MSEKFPPLMRKLGSANIIVLICVLLYFMGAGLALTLSARLAQAQEGAAPDLVTMDKIGRAGLVYLTNVEGSYLFAPEISTDVEIIVTGVTARTVVRQTFLNPTDSWLEGVYVVPLPDDSAIDHLRMVIGDRVIVAEIKEREIARQTYERAREEGQRAALLEQGRPNQFTVSVANIAPKSEITIELEYQTLIKVDDGLFELRLPMVVAPRYLPRMPGVATVSANAGPETAGPNDSVVYAPGGRDSGVAGDTLPGGPVLVEPVLVETMGERIHLPVTISVALDPGFAPSGVVSPFHEITVEETGANRFHVTLVDQMVPADRDFVLEWQVPLSGGPAAHVFTEQAEGRTYLLAMVSPPQSLDGQEPGPREMVFILDVSGSMHGPSIAQAKSALVTALSRLRPIDRFNVIAFSNASEAVFPEPVPATPNNLGLVGGFIGALAADGGTEMAPALDMALTQVNRSADVRAALRQIVLLTDGAVGNEDQLFGVIADRLGDARLFTIGIGSAPNSWFMRKSAEFGRGSYTHIGDVDQVEEKIVALLAKLEAPVLTDVEIGIQGDFRLELTAARIADLYRGEPVVVSGEMVPLDDNAAAAVVTVRGLLNGSPWSTAFKIDVGRRQAQGVASLWARRRIEVELDHLIEGADEDVVRAAVLRLALAHNLVSPYTSLVAVEEKIVRPADADVARADVPRHLPDGWSAEHVFGLPDPAITAGDRADAEPLMLKVADLSQTGPSARLGGRISGLPQTATPAGIMTLLGFGLLAAALMLLMVGRRRNRVPPETGLGDAA